MSSQTNPCLSDDGLLLRAIRAAKEAARRTIGAANRVQVLYRARRIILLLPERDAIARVGAADPASLASDARELAVSRYLAEKGAPVVEPSLVMGLEPFVEEGLSVTFWPYVEHGTADYDDLEAVASAARALRRVHEAFADYPAPLPSFMERIEQCEHPLRHADASPGLTAADRALLLRSYERLTEALSSFAIRCSPIHGDSHMGNVFFTPKGPLWTDFETACLGPCEWDIAGAPHRPAFANVDPELCNVLSELRGLCVAVWCSTLAADPDKRAAAEYHLAKIRERDVKR
jgi:hypothetical protein